MDRGAGYRWMNENTKSRGGGCRGVSYLLWLHWHLVGADNAFG